MAKFLDFSMVTLRYEGHHENVMRRVVWLEVHLQAERWPLV